MIHASQISLFQSNSRQVSTMEASQLRIRAQTSPDSRNSSSGQAGLSLSREAAYRYTSQERLAFSRSGQVSSGDRTASYNSAQLVEKTSELFLQGQQAMNVSRAVFGGEASAGSPSSLSVTAGRYLFYSESESRSFASTGSISLDNGETIDFTLSLRQSQSRTYEYSETLRIEERPMTDPLVINFGAATARLTDTLFEFDMQGNGETSSFASLGSGSGSGYLVFDRNGNGKVDDGSELFGPQSGSGFGELARFDDDGNRWIDASDEVFSSLSVWVQTADGNQSLRSLEEVGVQALYVDSAKDGFTLTNPQGVPLGQIKASGLYLTTGGEVRTLEELDLAEQETSAAQSETSLLVSSGDEAPASNQRTDDRIAAIRKALEKLNDIRKQQEDFIARSKEQDRAPSPLDEYLDLIDRLRLALLNSQDEKKQAASRYLDFARQEYRT